MAKPPAGSSLLFGALADSGRIKGRKNGSYRMVLKGIDEIDWFTDRPDRVAGEWSPKKLVRKWDGLFGDVEPNAQATFEVGNKRMLLNFEAFPPRLNEKSFRLSFNIKGIGNKYNDQIKRIAEQDLNNISLFIDDAGMSIELPDCFPDCRGAYLAHANLVEADLGGANSDFREANLFGANLSGASLAGANLANANLEGAMLFGAELTNTNLTDTRLKSTYLDSATLDYANLFGANLSRAHLKNAEIYYANFTEATLDSANLKGADLTGADLSAAKLTNANLNDANLYGTTLAGVNLSTAGLTGAIWNSTICPNGTMNNGTEPCTGDQLIPLA